MSNVQQSRCLIVFYHTHNQSLSYVPHNYFLIFDQEVISRPVLDRLRDAKDFHGHFKNCTDACIFAIFDVTTDHEPLQRYNQYWRIDVR